MESVVGDCALKEGGGLFDGTQSQRQRQEEEVEYVFDLVVDEDDDMDIELLGKRPAKLVQEDHSEPQACSSKEPQAGRVQSNAKRLRQSPDDNDTILAKRPSRLPANRTENLVNGYLNTEERRITLEERKLDLEERKVALDEKRLLLDEANQKATSETMRGVVDMVREVKDFLFSEYRQRSAANRQQEN